MPDDRHPARDATASRERDEDPRQVPEPDDLQAGRDARLDAGLVRRGGRAPVRDDRCRVLQSEAPAAEPRGHGRPMYGPGDPEGRVDSRSSRVPARRRARADRPADGREVSRRQNPDPAHLPARAEAPGQAGRRRAHRRVPGDHADIGTRGAGPSPGPAHGARPCRCRGGAGGPSGRASRASSAHAPGAPCRSWGRSRASQGRGARSPAPA